MKFQIVDYRLPIASGANRQSHLPLHSLAVAIVILFALAALLKHLATNHLRYAALMGVALGLAYLAKSFAFVFTFLCILVLIAFRFFWQRQSIARIAASAALVFVCFSMIAGPYIAGTRPSTCRPSRIWAVVNSQR